MTIGTIGPNLAQTLTATTLPTVQRALSQALETLPAGTAPDRTQAAAFVQTIVQSLDAALGDGARTPEQVRDAALAAARSALNGPTAPAATSIRDAGVLVDAVIRALEARGGGTAARTRPGAEPVPPTPPAEAPNPVRAPPALVAAVVETLQLTNTGTDADPAATALRALQTPAVLATQASAVSLASRNGEAPVTAAFVDSNPVPAPISASTAAARIASSPNPAPTQNASAVSASARDAAVLVEAILQALETSGVTASSGRRGDSATANHAPPALNSVAVQTALQSFVQAYFSSSRPLRRKAASSALDDSEDDDPAISDGEDAAPAPEPAHAAAAAYAQVGADGGGRLQRFGDRLSQHAGLGALKKAFDGLVAAFIGPETPAPVSLEAFLRNLEQALGAAGPAPPDGRFVRTRA